MHQSPSGRLRLGPAQCPTPMQPSRSSRRCAQGSLANAGLPGVLARSRTAWCVARINPAGRAGERGRSRRSLHPPPSASHAIPGTRGRRYSFDRPVTQQTWAGVTAGRSDAPLLPSAVIATAAVRPSDAKQMRAEPVRHHPWRHGSGRGLQAQSCGRRIHIAPSDRPGVRSKMLSRARELLVARSRKREVYEFPSDQDVGNAARAT